MSGNAILSVLTLWLFFGLIFTYFVYRFAYYRARQRENMYFLFSVRDRMIRMLVEEKLRKDEFLFKEFYPFVNFMIKEVNSLRFPHILKALESNSQVISDPFVAEFNREIAHKPPEVQQVFNQLFETIVGIIYRNSLLFRVVFRAASFVGVLKTFLLTTKKSFGVVQRIAQAYSYSEAYARMIIH